MVVNGTGINKIKWRNARFSNPPRSSQLEHINIHPLSLFSCIFSRITHICVSIFPHLHRITKRKCKEPASHNPSSPANRFDSWFVQCLKASQLHALSPFYDIFFLHSNTKNSQKQLKTIRFFCRLNWLQKRTNRLILS